MEKGNFVCKLTVNAWMGSQETMFVMELVGTIHQLCMNHLNEWNGRHSISLFSDQVNPPARQADNI
ncbi:hypothetical protein DVA76_18235, partial [Acinetobacter baumannii]